MRIIHLNKGKDNLAEEGCELTHVHSRARYPRNQKSVYIARQREMSLPDHLGLHILESSHHCFPNGFPWVSFICQENPLYFKMFTVHALLTPCPGTSSTINEGAQYVQRPYPRNENMPGIFQEQQGGQRTPPVLKSCKKSRCLERSTSGKRSGKGRQAGEVGASRFYAKCSEKPLEGWQPVTEDCRDRKGS